MKNTNNKVGKKVGIFGLVRKPRAMMFIYGFAFAFACVMCFALLFFMAYQHPDKIACVDINHYGEANIELVMFIIGIPCLWYFFWWLFWYIAGAKPRDIHR